MKESMLSTSHQHQLAASTSNSHRRHRHHYVSASGGRSANEVHNEAKVDANMPLVKVDANMPLRYPWSKLMLTCLASVVGQS